MSDPNAIQPGETYQHWLARTGQQPGGTAQKAVYIGIAAGSDLEKLGVPGPGYGQASSGMGAIYGQQFRGYYGTQKPLYKVGYQNSQQFSRELNNMDPNVIFLYQQRLYNAGLLSTFTPGTLDKATRAAFKDLLGTANQSASTWQSTLQNIEDAGGVAGKKKAEPAKPPPLTISLSNPDDIKAAISSTAKTLYGGDLPDSEVASMVATFQDKERQSQTQAYNQQYSPEGAAAGNGVYGPGGETVAAPNLSAFVEQQIKAAHPDQVAKVEFSGTLNNALSSLAKTGGGLM